MLGTSIKIDAHQHFWNYNPKEYDWINDDMAVIRKDFLPAQLKAELISAEIDSVISVQARQSEAETHQLLAFAKEHDFIAGVVGWLPMASANFEAILATYRQEPKLKGLRHVIQGESDDRYILSEAFNRGVRRTLEAGLAYDILILERHLPHATKFADHHEGQRLILDHIAKPKIAKGEIEPWRKNLKELAQREHVYCKLSGVVTEANIKNWKESDLLPFIEVAMEAFGPQRLMFGSDWPVLLTGMSYQAWINMIKNIVGRWSTSEQAQFWGLNAKSAYQLDTSAQGLKRKFDLTCSK